MIAASQLGGRMNLSESPLHLRPPCSNFIGKFSVVADPTVNNSPWIEGSGEVPVSHRHMSSYAAYAMNIRHHRKAWRGGSGPGKEGESSLILRNCK